MARLRLGLAGVLLFVIASGLLGAASTLRAPALAAGHGTFEIGGAEIDAWTEGEQSLLAAFADPWDDPDDELSGRGKEQPATGLKAASWRRPSSDATAALRRPCPPSTGPPASRAS
jgi:hypothetical protein